MEQKYIAKWSEQVIAQGILDLVFAEYETAQQNFADVVQDLEDRGNRFKPYLWTAAFGQGLAQGMSEREDPVEPRPISEVAMSAKELYEAFASFRRMPSDPERYRSLGKNYATMGLRDEGLTILDLSRDTDILSFYRLCPDAKKLFTEKP